MLKDTLRTFIRKLGYDVFKMPSDSSLYLPLYAPWNRPESKRYYAIAEPKSLVSADRCYVLERLLRHALQVPGDVFECGVYKGGTAALLAALLEETQSPKKLYLFDTFAGMPATDAERDLHSKGDFSDTSLEAVQAFVKGGPRCVFRQGRIPETFTGLDNAVFSFGHIDVDIYQSIIDTLNFMWPRLSPGGVIVFDDYGFPTCPGALQAVDEFFGNKASVPLCLQTGQAIVFKGPGEPSVKS
jgi:O-methyltransferase